MTRDGKQAGSAPGARGFWMPGLAMAMVLLLPCPPGARADESAGRQARCAALVSGHDVTAAVGLPVTDGSDDLDTGRREMLSPSWELEAHSLIRCARRFDGGDGRLLFVTLGKRRVASEPSPWYNLTDSTLQQLPDYAEIAGLGDAARRYTRGGSGIAIRELELVQGGWIVSVRTADGRHGNVRYAPLASFAQMEQVARAVSARLPAKAESHDLDD